MDGGESGEGGDRPSAESGEYEEGSEDPRYRGVVHVVAVLDLREVQALRLGQIVVGQSSRHRDHTAVRAMEWRHGGLMLALHQQGPPCCVVDLSAPKMWSNGAWYLTSAIAPSRTRRRSKTAAVDAGRLRP